VRLTREFVRDVLSTVVRKGLIFLRNAVVLAWTVVQSLVEYRSVSGRELSDTDRANWMHKWCATALRRLNIKCEWTGPLPQSGLLVSNHLGYLDIFVFGTAMPCVFVSKAEVRNWPVFGTLTTIAGTIYIDRARRSDTKTANDGIRRALQQGLPVVIFPEGTSSDGSRLLPFYPSLFEPAVDCGVPITAAHIQYNLEDGDVRRDIAYWGDMTFFPHLLKLLSKGGLSATVTFSDRSRIFDDRKVAATAVREEILSLGGYSSSSATGAELR